MDIIKIATQLVMQQFHGKSDASESQVQSALGGLLGGDFNIGDLVNKFASNGGLTNQLQSWLGDGGNDGISASNIMDVLGGDKVSNFASQLGISGEEAAGGLADVIPELIDKSSSGGNLLDSVGGLGGAMNLAKGLFK